MKHIFWYLHSLRFTSSVYLSILILIFWEHYVLHLFYLKIIFFAFNRLFCHQHDNVEEIMDAFNAIELRYILVWHTLFFISITFVSIYRLIFTKNLSTIKHIYRLEFEIRHLSLPQPYFFPRTPITNVSLSVYKKCPTMP